MIYFVCLLRSNNFKKQQSTNKQSKEPVIPGGEDEKQIEAQILQIVYMIEEGLVFPWPACPIRSEATFLDALLGRSDA